MAKYDEAMAPAYAEWRSPNPQVLDALAAKGAVRAVQAGTAHSSKTIIYLH
ncbi:MAG: hypothetical protein JO232_05725 [Verrucomicrobia bacterium]|nr:hypothetical protein [Verrucomicrobiota bacterium]